MAFAEIQFGDISTDEATSLASEVADVRSGAEACWRDDPLGTLPERILWLIRIETLKNGYEGILASG